ncbi:MAG: nuclear transport factor 2 family protein [Bacteroidota bacterium]|nr:nuclear transport factor 2 family protein [Bacteroidota bacterium]
MKLIISTYTFLILVIIPFSVDAQTDSQILFDVETIKPEIEANGKKWGEGLRSKNIEIISSIYDENAHYLPNGGYPIHGNKAILAYWESSFPYITDLNLTMETLEGTKELLYETGNGYAVIKNENVTENKFFKYVNVWKLQPDGTYKIVIDTYNDVKQGN